MCTTCSHRKQWHTYRQACIHDKLLRLCAAFIWLFHTEQSLTSNCMHVAVVLACWKPLAHTSGLRIHTWLLWCRNLLFRSFIFTLSWMCPYSSHWQRIYIYIPSSFSISVDNECAPTVFIDNLYLHLSFYISVDNPLLRAITEFYTEKTRRIINMINCNFSERVAFSSLGYLSLGHKSGIDFSKDLSS